MGLDQAAIEGLRGMIRAGGVRRLAVGDLRAGEVPGLAWSGNPAHLRRVAAALRRAGQGLEDYLVARAPAGEPVAKMRTGSSSPRYKPWRTRGQGPQDGRGCHEWCGRGEGVLPCRDGPLGVPPGEVSAWRWTGPVLGLLTVEA